MKGCAPSLFNESAAERARETGTPERTLQRQQAVTLSKYRVELLEDRRHIKEVSNPRIAETIFRSPQMMLFDLSSDEWLLYWKSPSYAPRRRTQPAPMVTQLALFEIQERAAGAEISLPFLRLVVAPKDSEQE